MRNVIDFSSWQGLLSTVLGLLLVSLVAVGIRLLFVQTVQRRRERENRQINERLKVLIAAYKNLGGSFTGNLAVDPAHLRDLRAATETGESQPAVGDESDRTPEGLGSDRKRRVRDAVEAALSDVILLGTQEHVRLAAQAANDMVAGRTVQTAALVVALRGFIREALDLDAIPADVTVPDQGPLRPAGGTSGRRSERGGAGEGGRGGGSRGGAGSASGGLHAETTGFGVGRSDPDAGA